MSKVVIFNGSPRKNGYTAKLLEEIKKRAKSQGSETITFDLNNSKIKGCQGCLYCRENDGCAKQDYWAEEANNHIWLSKNKNILNFFPYERKRTL